MVAAAGAVQPPRLRAGGTVPPPLISASRNLPETARSDTPPAPYQAIVHPALARG
jgi:hypothetical protein